MSMLATIRRFARYKLWADQLIFAAVAALPEEEALKPRASVFRNMVHTLNHVSVIDRIFQAHLEGREHGYNARNTAEHPPLAQLWREQQVIDAWYIAWSDALTEAAAGAVVDFTFVGGGAGRMTRGEIILHVVNHTSFHRGYVSDMIYQVPARPPVTDFPVFLRDVPQESA